MAVMTLIQAVTSALDVKLADDPNVLCFGEDVGLEGGVFRATEGLQKKYGEKRVFDTPLAESSIVGAAIGMAINGLRPVAEIQFDGFVHPATNQIVSHLARYRYRTRGQRPMPVVVRFPNGGGVRALELHSDSNEAIYAHFPGLKVVMPSTPYDAKGLLISAIEDDDPVIFMEPKRIYRAVKQDVPERDLPHTARQGACLAGGDGFDHRHLRRDGAHGAAGAGGDEEDGGVRRTDRFAHDLSRWIRRRLSNR